MVKAERIIRIESKSGASLVIDAGALKPGARLQAGLDHLLAGGKLEDLDPRSRVALAKKKSLIGVGENALIIRFDLKVIRIDEKLPIDLGGLVKKRGAGNVR
jgi:hypothetical protein